MSHDIGGNSLVISLLMSRFHSFLCLFFFHFSDETNETSDSSIEINVICVGL
jgi:hypothetical protein